MEIIIDNIKYELRTEENGAYVVENNYKGEVVIPAEIQVDGLTIPVIGIEEDAFYGCDDVTCVTLPDGLQVIEKSAFESMNGLRAIVIPDTVNHIGELAFSDCQHLQQVTLPARLQHLSADLFESCYALEQIILPPGVKTIGYGCFAACQQLRRVVLPEGLERIDSRAFDMCESLTDIHIPSTVREMGEAAFYACHSLQRITLPEGLTYVPVDCFALCQSLEHIDIPASVQLVEAGALDLTPYHRHDIHYAHDLLVSVGSVDTPDGCLTIPEGIRVVCDTAVSDHDHTLRRFVCPSSLRQIGRCAFRYSHNLEEVVLNEGLEFIDGGAFADCKKLRRIYIPSTVKRIETNPFSCCDMLEEIVVSPDNPYFDSRANCNAILETATNRLITACRTSVIPDDTEVIGAVAFADIDTLEQLTLPASVTRIEWNAFNGCKNLSEVLFSSQLSYVGDEAFHHTAWLAKQPQGMVIMGKVLYQYRSCGTIFFEPDCVIPEGIEYIARDAFQWLQYPMRVFLPRSLKSCAPRAFHSIDYDPILIRPEGVPADYPCTDTTYHSAWIDGLFYVLDDFCKTATVTRPYERQLYRGHIRIPEQVNYEGLTYTVNCIGYRAFAFDDQYAYEVFEEKDLGRVVDGCSVLESPCYVEIPASVTRIEDEAFLRCFDLCCVQLHAEASIGLDAFKDCHGLQTILVPTDLVENYCQQHSTLREYISDRVTQIDGIFYQLDTHQQKARVVAHYHSNEEKYAQYTGHIAIPATIDYQGIIYQVVAISAYAFYQSSIEAIDLPDGLERIGREAFTYCENLCEVVLPQNIAYVGEGAFRYTAWLKSRPKGVVVIGSVLYQYKPFYEDGREPDCAIPEGVETIAHGAFGDMNPRMRVFLPRSLKTFDPMAFGDIADYVLVRPEGVGEDYPYTDTSYCSAWIDGIFYVLDSWVKTATVVRPYERMLYRGHIVIPESVNYEGVDYRVTWIGYRAFAFDYAYGEDMFEAYGRVENACTVLETPCCVEIPASVVCIEEEAFLHCFDLRGVVLHGRHGVGRNVFDECRRLQTIVVPTELKQYYRDDELSNYWNLITDCVVQIDGISYNLDTNLMTAQVISPLADAPDYEGHVVIPEKVDYEGNAYLVDEIAHFAFFGHEIEKIDLPPSLTVIGENAFLECERLCSVDIPERVTYIGEDAFADCTNLCCVRMSEELGRKMQDYSWIGLESEQEELFAIEKQEDTSDFDRLLDWFIEHQLNGSHTEDAQGDEAPI